MREDNLAQSAATPPLAKMWLALLLAWVAGFVDVFGYLTVLQTFTSHLSGNSVAMVAAFTKHEWSTAIRHAVPIPAFVAGVFIAATLGIFAGRKQMHRRLSMAISFEIALLVAFAFYHGPAMRPGPGVPHAHFWIASAFLAMAMGVQTAALRQVWGKPIHTTFVTGMLAHFGENAAEVLFKKEKPSEGRSTLRVMLLDGTVWFAFIAGAGCGGFAELSWKLAALALPICLLVAIMCWDLVRPFHKVL